MKNKIKNITLCLGIAVYILINVGMVIAITTYRFGNPELTQTQIMLYCWDTYWYIILVDIILYIIATIKK